MVSAWKNYTDLWNGTIAKNNYVYFQKVHDLEGQDFNRHHEYRQN